MPFPRPLRTQPSQLAASESGFREGIGWACGLPSDPGWALHAQPPSLTPSTTGDDEETGEWVGESPPQTLSLVAARRPAGPDWGTFSSKHRAGSPRGRGLMAGTQQAGRASWPGLPLQLASQPSLHHASSPRLLAPCHARLGRVSRQGPSHRLKLPLSGPETPSPVPQSSECAAWPAATGGPSPLPKGPFNSLSLPSHLSFLFWGPLFPALLLFIFGPCHFLSGVVVGGGGRRHFIQIPAKKQSHLALVCRCGNEHKGEAASCRPLRTWPGPHSCISPWACLLWSSVQMVSWDSAGLEGSWPRRLGKETVSPPHPAPAHISPWILFKVVKVFH